MSVDPSVLAAISSVVDRDPQNLSLRLHYGDLLHQDQQFQLALYQYVIVLQAQPDNVEVLRKAADAAEGTNDKIKAAGYRKLSEALGWDRTKNLIDSAGEPAPAPTVLRAASDLVAPAAQEPEDTSEVERPEISLKDVAGMEQVKRRLNSAFLAPFRNPDLRKMYGKSLKGGLLLYGPPGCGKTYIARALAGEIGAKFIAVGITDVVDMYLGESEKKLHAYFEEARRHAPCVLFFDEIDAMGRKRSLMRESAGRTLINQLLTELDGQGNNEGLFVLAATNHPWDVDTALRRPGRFDRSVLVLPPDQVARKEIFRLNLIDRPTNKIDIDWLATKSEDFSGADIAYLCESAAEMAMESSIESGVTRPIVLGDFKSAMKDVRQSTRAWFENAKNYALYANEAGLYDDLLEYLRARKIV